MADWTGKTYWLVGASEGLGLALARRISKTGARVILSARNEEALQAAAAAMPGPCEVLPMDISDDASVAGAAARAGPVDGLVLLAGVYWPFGARDWNREQAVAMADINFTGYVRVLGHVVPGMVARDAGHIVITSSLTAYRGLPGSIGYTAAKAGTLSLAECLRADLRRSGVKVQVAVPGFIRTRLTEKNDFHMPGLMTAEDAAGRMFALMTSTRFRKVFPTLFGQTLRAAQFLPDAIYYPLFGQG